MLHNTLNEALIAAKIPLTAWPLGLNIGYNQTGRVVKDGLFVSVTRFENGLYETAISYASKCENFQQVIDN